MGGAKEWTVRYGWNRRVGGVRDWAEPGIRPARKVGIGGLGGVRDRAEVRRGQLAGRVLAPAGLVSWPRSLDLKATVCQTPDPGEPLP